MIKVESQIKIDPRLEKAWDKIFLNKEARFFELPDRTDLWKASQARADEIKAKFKQTCLVGIGGSSLGARALNESFGRRSRHKVTIIESPDMSVAGLWYSELQPLQETHFIFVSKSGKTLETLSLLDYWQTLLKEHGLNLAKQSTVICGAASSPLRSWAEENSVPILPVPEDVGGRFSVLCPVGLLPAALMGVSLEYLRSGARDMLKKKEDVFKLASECLKSWEDDKWIAQMWVYSGSFHTLGLWWQQLWGESLGKKQNRAGAPAPRVSTPMVCLGPQDQHSLLQQLQEGERDKWVIALRDNDAEQTGPSFQGQTLSKLDPQFSKGELGSILRAEVEGFLGAMKEAGVPTLTLRGSSSKAESWGAFFMLWELTIAILGEVLEIDAFDQPGVELGKRLAFQVLRQQ